MVVGQIDGFLQIIMAMSSTTGGEAPFVTHKDLYSMIDMTNLGNAPWGSFQSQLPGQQGSQSSIMAN